MPSTRLQVIASAAVAAAALLVSFKAEAKARCPKDMALVGESCVDKYEATLVDAATDAPVSSFENPNGRPVRAVSKAGVVPQGHVSLVDAKNACAASKKRLCRAAEWKMACKGPEQTKYPYGNAHVPGACVDTGRTAPLGKLYSAKEMFTGKAMNDPRLNQMDNTVAKTGEAAQCTNGYGVHDMVGNLHEWVDDGAFHGGYYLDTKTNREGCDYATTAHNSVYYDYSTGFRCCADADSLPVEDDEPKAPPVESKMQTQAIEVDDSMLGKLARVVEGLGGSQGSTASAMVISAAPALPALTRNRTSRSSRRAS